MTDRLLDLIEASAELWRNASPEQRRAWSDAQKRSFIRAEAGFGSDVDEAAYRSAVERGDKEAIARLDAEAEERMRRADEIMRDML